MIGTRISHFEILALIAQGGMGVVYKAEDLDLGRTVAIKVLPPHLIGDEDRRARFVSEARTAAAVTHPNIATVYEIGEENGVIFIAMELVEGRTLRSLVDEKPLPMKETLRLATEIAEGLAAAHLAKIAHRDLKPDNILVTADGHVKILDFGLARLLEPPRDPPPDDAGAAEQLPSGTQSGDSGHAPPPEPQGVVSGPGDDVPLGEAVTIPIGDRKVLGTPVYMSPEQARGQDLDYRTDIFSFGSTFYEMVTGRPPFQGGTSTETIREIIHKEPLPAASLNPETPSSVEWILDKCLEKDPALRYQDTRDLVVDLRHLYPDTGTQSVPRGPGRSWTATGGPHSPPAGPVWKRPVPVLAAALIGVLALAGVRLHGRAKLAVPPAEANSLAVFTFENLKDPEDPERLGEILQELLITDLSGLEALKVFSSQRLSDIERQLERRGSNAADRGITNEVATHAGAQTMLTGSLSHLGDTWILTAQLSDVERGTVLKSKRIDGDDLYAMVDQLTAEIQSELAIETPTEIAARSIKEKTSTSKEAWSHYLGGVDHLNANQFNEAVLELTRAVEIDPGFGQAYYKLGIATWWLYSDAGAGQEQIIHLLENELYASKKEKEMAEGMLLVIQNKWSEAFPVLRRVTHTYPDEKHAWYGLGEAQFHFPGGSQQHESLEAFERAVALDPDFLLPYWHIFDVLWGEKRYDEAIARAAALIEHDPQNPLWHRYRAGSVAFRGDREETQKVLAEALTYNTTAEDQRELYHLVALSIANLGYVDRAEGYLRQALQVDPGHDDPRIVRQLMGYLWDQRKFDEVEAQLHELLVRDPMNDRLLEDLFRVYMAKNEYEKAHQLALDLVRKEADDPRWYRYWAQCTIYNGDEEANARVIREAIERNSSADDRRNLFGAIGAAYSHTGNHNKAKEYFQKAIAVDPEQDYPNYFSEIGFQDLRRGCYDEAEVWIRKAMKLAPKNVHHLITLAHVNVERGEFEEAVRNLEEVLEILPPSELFPFLAMSLKVFTGDLQEVDRKLAVEETSLATETQKWEFLYSRPWKLPFGVAWSYLLAGHYERAAEVFQWAQSFELNQRDPVAYEGLGWTYLCLGDHGRAEQAFLAGLEIGYDHRSTLYGLAVLKLLQGEPESAESYVERALEGPPHVAFSRLLATVYAAQERYVEARALAEEALAMDSSRASHELLAWILIAGELDIQKGIEVAKRAVEIPIRFSEVEKALPHRASAEHSLGLAYLKQGRTDLATKHLQRAAVLQPNRTSIHLDLQRALGLLSGTQ